MCGICGFNWNDRELIIRMTDAMSHRGPDQHGLYCSPDISLGHRRLSIIDLSEHGRQPMFNEDKSVCLMADGEIYNFMDLREELISKGHVFTSLSDSESILHTYEEYGPDALQKLRGKQGYSLPVKHILRDQLKQSMRVSQ